MSNDSLHNVRNPRLQSGSIKFCDNPWCRARIKRPIRKGIQFCSETCWRKLLTHDELQLAIKLELADDKSGLDSLRGTVSKRYKKKVDLLKERFYANPRTNPRTKSGSDVN
jgi:hypothetical protein